MDSDATQYQKDIKLLEKYDLGFTEKRLKLFLKESRVGLRSDSPKIFFLELLLSQGFFNKDVMKGLYTDSEKRIKIFLNRLCFLGNVCKSDRMCVWLNPEWVERTKIFGEKKRK